MFGAIARGRRAAHVCSQQHGDGDGGDITYITTCDAERRTNTVRLWVTDVAFHARAPDGHPWTNPCPVPAGSGDDRSTWTGGCTTTEYCFENEDTLVEFDVDLQSAGDVGGE